MSTEKYAQYISQEIKNGLYEATGHKINVSFISQPNATRFVKDLSSMGIKNIVANMKNISFDIKDDNQLFKIMPIIDKHGGNLKQ